MSEKEDGIKGIETEIDKSGNVIIKLKKDKIEECQILSDWQLEYTREKIENKIIDLLKR